jgi:hypothetical protein
MGVLSTGVAAGMQAGEGQNSIGEYIKGILATANKKGLLNTQAEGNIRLAQETAKAKAQYTKPKKFLKVGESGEGEYVTGPVGETEFDQGTSIITPREGLTVGEKASKSAEGNLEADIINRMREAQNVAAGGGDTNVVEQNFQNRSLSDATAGGMATSTVEGRKQAIEWLNANGAPVTEGNIEATIQRMGL